MKKSNEQRMFKRIIRWQQSGLSQKAWCEKSNIAYSTFHYWYKRYRSQQDGGDSGDTGGAGEFVQLTVGASPLRALACELVLPDGKRLLFHQPVSADFIRTLIG